MSASSDSTDEDEFDCVLVEYSESAVRIEL
jgi:hypothetical protein